MNYGIRSEYDVFNTSPMEAVRYKRGNDLVWFLMQAPHIYPPPDFEDHPELYPHLQTMSSYGIIYRFPIRHLRTRQLERFQAFATFFEEEEIGTRTILQIGDRLEQGHHIIFEIDTTNGEELVSGTYPIYYDLKNYLELRQEFYNQLENFELILPHLLFIYEH
jgi:hypothetical protein